MPETGDYLIQFLIFISPAHFTSDKMMKTMLQKIRLLELELPIFLATLLAVCLGGVAAWAATGAFSVGLFLIIAVLGIAVQVGIRRTEPYLLEAMLVLLPIAVYWVQTRQLDGTPIWGAFVIAFPWSHGFRNVLRRRALIRRMSVRLLLTVYGFLFIGIAVGNIPVWSMLCLLSAPLAWRAHKPADAGISEEWAVVTGMFLVAGYVIRWLIR